jgi:O-antigen ligase
MDAHNMFLRVAAEMGILGLLSFLLILVIPFFAMRHVYRTTADRFMRGWMLGGMASLFGIIVVNMFGSRFVREELVGLYWIMVALTYAYIYVRRNRAARLQQTTSRELTAAASAVYRLQPAPLLHLGKK